MDVFTSAVRCRLGAGAGRSFNCTISTFQARNSGYTLIEVLVTLAIVSIGLRVAFASLHPLLVENRLAVRVNTLVGMLQMARSEAISRNRQVVICHSTDGETCDRVADWTENWLVFVDDNRDRQRDADESVVAFRQAPENGTRVIYRAFGSRHYLAYRPDGRTRTNGTFTVCDPRFPELNRALIVTKSGRPRLSRYGPGGRQLRCE